MQNYNPDDIITRIKKPPKMAIVCLVFAILFLILGIVGLVMAIMEEAMAIAFIFCGFPFALMFLVIFIVKIIKSKNALKNVNFDVIRQELMNGCMAYNNSVFFTQNYLIGNHYTAFVTSYMDIVWIFQIDKYANGIYCGADLSINLVTGKKVAIPYSNQFVEEIRRHNPIVLVGVSHENKKEYKRKVEEFKKYSTTTNGMTYQQVNDQGPQNYKPMSAEDPIYQFNQISKEMREAQNRPAQQQVPVQEPAPVQQPIPVQESVQQVQQPIPAQEPVQVPVQQVPVQEANPQPVMQAPVQEQGVPLVSNNQVQAQMPVQPMMNQNQ